MASTQLSRSISSAGSTTTATLSCWFKRENIGAEGFLFYNIENGNNNCRVRFNTDSKLEVEGLQGGSQAYTLRTVRTFTDPAAWYHLVVRYDSTDSTADNRIRIYVNGTEETNLENRNNPSSSGNMSFNEAGTVYIGGQAGSNYFGGCITHYHWVDGNSYAPTVFGETDATSGIWKPKTSPSGVTYGTNGFFLKFANSGNLDLDSSGNNQSFTTAGSLTQTVDTPSNNFATLNKLSTHGNNTLSFGSLRIAFTANTSYTNSIGTLGINSGRWYVEAKVAGATTYYPCIGFCSMGNNTRRYYDPLYTAAHLGADEGTGYFAHGNIQKNGSTDGDYATFTTGDIISMYLDLESGTKTMKYYKNDSLIRSTTITPVAGQFYTFGATGTSGSDIVDFNFGSGFFGTTAVTSANADANGFGAFEYSPTLSGVNYYALNTKNIKEFG